VVVFLSPGRVKVVPGEIRDPTVLDRASEVDLGAETLAYLRGRLAARVYVERSHDEAMGQPNKTPPSLRTHLLQQRVP
jgi:hypothetical protein